MNFSIRPDGFQNERADCTVCALAAAAGVEYALAHATLKRAGSRDGRRFKMCGFMSDIEVLLGKSVFQISINRSQLASFVKDHPVGHFLLRKSGHCFAVIDGCVENAGHAISHRTRITHVWEFSKLQ